MTNFTLNLLENLRMPWQISIIFGKALDTLIAKIPFSLVSSEYIFWEQDDRIFQQWNTFLSLEF